MKLEETVRIISTSSLPWSSTTSIGLASSANCTHPLSSLATPRWNGFFFPEGRYVLKALLSTYSVAVVHPIYLRNRRNAAIVVFEYQGVYGIRTRMWILFRTERSFGAVGNGNTKMEYVIFIFHTIYEIILAILSTTSLSHNCRPAHTISSTFRMIPRLCKVCSILVYRKTTVIFHVGSGHRCHFQECPIPQSGKDIYSLPLKTCAAGSAM